MLKCFAVPVATILAILVAPQSARACSDNQMCGPAGSPLRQAYDACSALPLLTPGNDSRVNLWMLLDDAQPLPLEPARGKASVTPELWLVPFSYSVLATAAIGPADGESLLTSLPRAMLRGEGSRCVSEAQGRAAFEAAVAAAALPAEEKTELAALRATLPGRCEAPAGQTAPQAPAPAAVKSALGLAFARYISGAAAFYDGRFDAALGDFEALAGAGDPWLKESAAYMIGRVLLNKAQVDAFNLDDPTPKIKDQTSLQASEKALNAYLGAYPKGRYTASARGLLRRLYWLGGDKTRLVAEYDRLAQEKGSDPLARFDFLEEVDQKLLIPDGEASKSPQLVAVRDLMRFREKRGEHGVGAAELEAQAPIFAAQPALFSYLKAARAFYVDDDPKAALQWLGPPGPAKSHLDFSREALRALALAATGDAGAEAAWQGLIAGAERPWRRDAAELGLAFLWERARTINKVFMPESPVRSEAIRNVLLRNIAGPILLRQQAEDAKATPGERTTARFTLLYKDATRGHYAGFVKDYAAVEPFLDDDKAAFDSTLKLGVFRWRGQSAPYACPPLKNVMEKLAASAKDPRALLCLGEFTRTQIADGFELDRQPQADQLGGEKPIFPGGPFSRGDIYKAVIADKATPDDARAYALYRAIHCYAPSGANGCGGEEVSKSVRKAWYDALKGRYGALPYVKSLRYYW